MDVVNGGAGIDTLKVATDGTAVGLPNMTSVEIVDVESAGAATVNTSAVTGVTNLNVLKAGTSVSATAAATTDINVSLKQGAANSVTANNAADDVYANIAVNGGKNVTVNVTDVKKVLGGAAEATELNAIAIGGITAAAGTVTVTSTGAKTVAGTDAVLSSIAVTGGTTISVTQKATSDAAAAAADVTGATITQGAVNVIGNAYTTTVTVKQDASVAEVVAAPAVAAKAATQEVTFGALAAGQSVAVNFGGGRLAFTANKALTAAQVASAFANLVEEAVQGNASASLGVYSSAVWGSDVWTSGAVQTVSSTAAKVKFSSDFAAAALADGGGTVDLTGGLGAFSGAAVVAAEAETGVLGVVNGRVDIEDSGAGFIKTITIDGYGANSDIGSSTASTDALETLNLSNSGLTFTAGKVSAAAGITVDDTAATLALNLEKVGFSGYYDGNGSTTTVAAAVALTAAPTTLNVTSTGNNYVALTANATTALNVAGTGLLDVSKQADNTTANDLAGLTTVTVTGSAGLKLSGLEANTLTSVNTSGTTGAVTASIEGNRATYTGGAGVDNVTVTNPGTVISKAISLGAGNDKLDLSAAIPALPTVVIDGGDGTDTLKLSAAGADSTTGVTANTSFASKITGFEKLEVGNLATGAVTVNMANLNAINYVISNGSTGTAEVQTIDLTGVSAGANGNFTVAGVTVAVFAADTTQEIANRVVTALNNEAAGTPIGNATATNAAGTSTVVTIAYSALDGNVGQASVTNGTATLSGTGTAGTSITGYAPATLTFDKLLADATVELKKQGDVEAKLKDASGSADVLNVVTKGDNGTGLGTLKASSVETINVSASDTLTTTSFDWRTGDVIDDVSWNGLTLDVNKAKTVNLSGAGNLWLNLTAASTEVTLIDGSTATGDLRVRTNAADTAATTVKGGSGDDYLVALGANDVLLGGAGDDLLEVSGNAASAVTLTGGEGVDQFDVSGFRAANAGAAATITDLAKGETIRFEFSSTANFASSKVTLISQATFDNYVTEAAKAAAAFAGGTDGLAWFQFGGDTFIVQDRAGVLGAFDNNADIIVKLTGLVDLSASSFNDISEGTLLYI